MKIETHSVRSSRSLTSRLIAFVVIAVASTLAAGNAWAKDSMTVSVTNTVPTPHVVNNGEAVGTIQLFYTVNADAFILGDFATFDINWLTSAVDAKKATDYGTGVLFKLEQDQQGGFVDLQPSPETFTLTKTGQTGTARVTVHITPDKAGKLPPSADGTDLVGNLKLDAGKDVGTVTNIQVHIRLVHPTECVKVYNFVTDEDFSMGILSTTSLTVPKEERRQGR